MTRCIQITYYLLNRNSSKNKAQLPNQRINCCSKPIFLDPVTEDEIECVIKSLKDKLSAGHNEIPQYLLKQCLKYITKLPVHIYCTLLHSGIFPD
jgi:hypothetical protein